MSRDGGRRSAIRCPIGLFPKQEADVIRLTRAINRAPTAAEKAPLAQKLLDVVSVLLACEEHDEGALDCRLCRQFSHLRQKAGTLIVRAGQLGH
jgi:hypothetical protein